MRYLYAIDVPDGSVDPERLAHEVRMAVGVLTFGATVERIDIEDVATSRQTLTGRANAATSHEAARRFAATPRPGTTRAAVLMYLLEHRRSDGSYGASDVELAEALRLSPNTERPRRVELVRGGWVRDSGRTVVHHGEAHVIWEPTVLAFRAYEVA